MSEERETDGVRWYQVPVLWVGILALTGSILGCVLTVAVSMRHADDALADVAPGGKFQMEPLDASKDGSRDRPEPQP
ncbi:hypothetical protein [Halofilum ochraceum]|uniref:hypothetical protein n=1 Tax=Halofilum ochraceum TaxID=1611323 RepID=UPI00082EC842|nr:hypothetical protein [Halofilum ochraceum]